MVISFEIEGEKQLIRKFRGMEIKGKDWKPTFKRIGKDLTGVFSGPVFETRGREIGEPWKRRIKSYPWPLLQKSGKMRKGFRFKAKNVSLEIYNIQNYFVYHQSRKPRKTNLSRRIMMKLDAKRKTRIMKEFHGDLFKKLYPRRIMGQVIKW